MTDVKDPRLADESAVVPVDEQHAEGDHGLDKRITIMGAPINSTVFIEDMYPLYKYVILLGCTLNIFITFGFIGSWGVFQEHFLNVIYKGQVTATQISFVGSLLTALAFGVAVIAGPFIRKFGERFVLAVGAAIFPLGILISSWTNAVWQLFLSLGIISGFGAGCILISSWPYIAKYWDKRRGFAMGLISAGSGFGGLAFSPAVRKMIENIDYHWAFRIYAFMAWGVLLFNVLVMKQFDKPKGTFAFVDRDGKEQGFWRGFIDSFSLLKDKRILVLIIGSFFMTFTYRIPYFYVPSYAVSIGATASDGALALGLLNGFSGGARVVFGFASDYVGPGNGLIFTTIVSAVAVFFVWIFTKSYGVLIFFSILYGLGSGGDAGLFIIFLRSFVPVEHFAEVVALSYFIQIPGNLSGASIFGALTGIPRPDGTKGPYYLPAQLFGGCMWIVVLFFYTATRFMVSRKLAARI